MTAQHRKDWWKFENNVKGKFVEKYFTRKERLVLFLFYCCPHEISNVHHIGHGIYNIRNRTGIGTRTIVEIRDRFKDHCRYELKHFTGGIEK